jgi:hypothetical protein
MRRLACAAAAALIGVAVSPAQAQPRDLYDPGWGYPGYGYRHPHGFGGGVAADIVGGPGIVVVPVVPGYVEGPVPAYGPVGPPDLYAAPHEIRGGYRTVYVPGRGRVIVGPPVD